VHKLRRVIKPSPQISRLHFSDYFLTTHRKKVQTTLGGVHGRDPPIAVTNPDAANEVSGGDARHPLHPRRNRPTHGLDSSGARFLPLADGTGDTHISCLHLEQGARSHAATLLVVHGRITITTQLDAMATPKNAASKVRQHTPHILGFRWPVLW
jgi:hypothetical protein